MSNQAATIAPLITFDEACAVGDELHDRWRDIAGKAPLEREDLAWVDMVQFVLRRIHATVKAREGGDG